MAEAGMQDRCASVVVCRMPLMFGDSGPAGSSFLQPLLAQMRSGKDVNLFADEFRTPLSGKDAASGLMIALETRPDVVHFGGMDRVSRYVFGKRVTKIYHIHNAKLRSCRQQDIRMSAPRPRDVSLTNARAVAMGFKPEPLEASLERLKKEMESLSEA